MCDVELSAKYMLHRDYIKKMPKANISFKKFKKLQTQKRCAFTKISFNDNLYTTGHALQRMIVKIDHTKPYEDSNLIAVTAIASKIARFLPSVNIKKAHKFIPLIRKQYKESCLKQ